MKELVGEVILSWVSLEKYPNRVHFTWEMRVTKGKWFGNLQDRGMAFRLNLWAQF